VVLQGESECAAMIEAHKVRGSPSCLVSFWLVAIDTQTLPSVSIFCTVVFGANDTCARLLLGYRLFINRRACETKASWSNS
jgi:hypothetical protein